MAVWYPQMGGYAGKAVAVMGGPEDCPDLYVWHDGDFPFDDEEDGRGPIRLHHCDPEQFRLLADHLVEFGELLKRETR